MEQRADLGRQPVTVHGVLARTDYPVSDAATDPCTLRFTLLSWRQRDQGTAGGERLRVFRQYADRQTYDAALSSLPGPMRCVSAVVRGPDEDTAMSWNSRSYHAELVGPMIRIAPDPELLSSAWAVAAGVERVADGAIPPTNFRLDEKFGYWETSYRFRNRDIDIQIEATAEYPPQKLDEITESIARSLADRWPAIERALLRRLHELYNEVWRDPTTTARLSERAFLDHLILETLELADEGALSLQFADSDLFAGQTVLVKWSPEQSLQVSLQV